MPRIEEEIKNSIDAANVEFTKFVGRNNDRMTKVEKGLRELENDTARLGPRGGSGEVRSSEVMKNMGLFVISGDASKIRNSATIGNDPSGGFLVEPEIDRELSKVLRSLSPMREVADVVQSRSYSFERIVSMNNAEGGWVGEVSSRPETDAPDLKKTSIPANEVYANPAASQNLLEDTAEKAGEWILEAIAEAFAALEGNAYIVGNGIIKPRGILTYPIATTVDATRPWGTVQYVASGGTGAFATTNPGDKLIDLVHALKAPYRKNARFLMNTLTLGAVRKLKDGQGNYLIQPNYRDGLTETLLGYPITEMADMPDIAADSLSIAFGDWQKSYLIVDRITSILRDPFTNKPYVHFYARRRTGGDVYNFEAFKLMKFATS